MDVQEGAAGPNGPATDSATYLRAPDPGRRKYPPATRGGSLLHEVTHDQTTAPCPRPVGRRGGLQLASCDDGTARDSRAGHLLAERVGKPLQQRPDVALGIAVGVAFLTAGYGTSGCRAGVPFSVPPGGQLSGPC